MPPPKYWSPERDAILKQEWPGTKTPAEIKPLIDPLPPGLPVTTHHIGDRATALRLKRSPEFARAQRMAILHGALSTAPWSKAQILALKLAVEARLSNADTLSLVNAAEGTPRSMGAMKRKRGDLTYQPKRAAQIIVPAFRAPPVVRKKYRPPAPIDPAPYAGTRRVSQAVGFSMLGRRAA